MAGHAPAPWSRDDYGHIVDARRQFICIVPGTIVTLGRGTPEDTEMAQANTDLFFAAPEMLAMLKRVVWTIEDASLYGEVVALIDKAERKEA